MTDVMQMTVQPGTQAPDFSVPAVQHDRLVSLGDYRGKNALLLGLFPGLYCPFCRRSIAMMAATSEKLKACGVESLAIVGTELDNARLYFKYRPTPLLLAADATLTTHRTYGVPRPEPTPQLLDSITNLRINPFGDLPEALPVPEAAATLNARDAFRPTAADQRDGESNFTQMKGQFIIDRDGVIRWTNIECGREGLSGLGKFPTPDELMAAARLVAA
jgi:peroxiredoxin